MSIQTEKNIWGVRFPLSVLDSDTVNYLKNLPQDIPDREWLLQEMDQVWFNYKLDNKQLLVSQPIDKYYSHPVWIVNGIFSATDPISVSHREAIAKYLKKNNHKEIADYGGGFAELALQISAYNPQSKITIVEPYPSEIGKYRISMNDKISFADRLKNNYDAVIAQDVLEHVEQPIDLAYKIADAVKDGGILIFANCFQPIIQCHLPSTFHLRHTFSLVMKAMGLKYIGRIYGCHHAQIFRKTDKPLKLHGAKKVERISKIIGPALNNILKPFVKVKNTIGKISK